MEITSAASPALRNLRMVRHPANEIEGVPEGSLIKQQPCSSFRPSPISIEQSEKEDPEKGRYE